ncbi:MAG TPA: TetR/AcrR family transcriptional regulator [Acidimicrobiales bacterium]|nr:TetR/AcrR family transcriptional regulator [Acidimicrobiales bacterium]
MRTVLDAVADRLRDGDERLLRIPEVCRATGVNYGSVYHHFGSREGVIEAAYEMMFTEIIEQDLAMVRRAIETTASQDGFLLAIQGVLETVSTGPDRRASRTMRLRIVAASTTRPDLREIISASQARVTAELAEIVGFCQGQGWIRADMSSRSIAVILQVVIFGRNLDDLSAKPIPEQEWSTFMFHLFTHLLTPS